MTEKRNLVIITADITNGNWLVEEMPHHIGKGYDDILAFNTESVDMNCVPEDIRPYCANISHDRPQILLKMLCALTYRDLWHEVRRLSGPDKIARAYRAWIMFAYALNDRDHIIRELNRKGISKNDRVIFYAYWMSVQAICAVLLKRKYLNSIAVSRCHRTDLYEEFAKDGYLECRDMLIDRLDEIYSISSDGIEHIHKNYPDRKVLLSRLGSKDRGMPARVAPREREELKVISCSTISVVKRVDMIADILSELKCRVVWEHYGDGPLRPEFLKKVSELPDNVRFIFHGKVSHDEMLDRFVSGEDHVLINTSSSEGIPVSVMEAYSAGLPVIAYDVGGMREIIKGNLSEYLIGDVEDFDMFKSKIEKIINMSQDEYAVLCISCHKIWKEEYNSDANYHAFAEELASLS